MVWRVALEGFYGHSLAAATPSPGGPRLAYWRGSLPSFSGDCVYLIDPGGNVIWRNGNPEVRATRSIAFNDDGAKVALYRSGARYPSGALSEALTVLSAADGGLLREVLALPLGGGEWPDGISGGSSIRWLGANSVLVAGGAGKSIIVRFNEDFEAELVCRIEAAILPVFSPAGAGERGTLTGLVAAVPGETSFTAWAVHERNPR